MTGTVRSRVLLFAVLACTLIAAALPKGFSERNASVSDVKIHYTIGGNGAVVVLLDAFLPGLGNWKDLWLARDLWHFHFYGETPEALVKGRERIYLEHFWNDFAADRTKSVPEADRRLYAAAFARNNGIHATFQY